tara:strand:- start:673 stop:1278 length:606 start_codon:yes stop_codon:yes gene_type:complete
MAGARLTAYGSSAKGSGYADADMACSRTTGGTQLLAFDDSAVYAYAEADDAGGRLYLVKIASPTIPAHYYNQGDGFEAGQAVYVPVQTIGGIYGAITNAGYYTVSLDAGISEAAYITTLASEAQVTQPTACPEADPFPNKESTPTGDEYTTEFVDNQMSQLVTQYERGTGLESFVPIRMTVRGPSNLRRRPQSLVYKVTKG